jgi:hypothetical protein
MIKKRIILSLTLFLMLPACTSTLGKPDWYDKSSSSDGIIRGYGVGEDENQARQDAYKSISEQIEVRVTSQTALIKKFDNDQISTQTREITQLKSTHILKHVETIHLEQVAELYYIGLQQDRRPIKQQLESKLNELGVTAPTFSGSPVITNSTLMKSLGSESGVKLPVSLQRKEYQWYLAIGELLQPIEDLADVTNWSIKPNSSMTISLVGKDENRLKSGEDFQLSINSQNDINYLTVFNIYSDGRVVTLLDNKSISTLTTLYPETGSENQLIASPIMPGQKDRDLYLTIGTKRKIDTTLFSKTTALLETGEESFNLHKFINWLDSQSVVSIAHLYVEIFP